MAHHKQREPRKPVFVRARMQSGGGWVDVHIRNVSSRGLMGQCPAPPPRGTYIDLRCRSHVIVGRVVWQGGDHFGLYTQERIDVAALLSDAPAKPPSTERRVRPRPSSAVSPAVSTAAQFERSRRMASLMNFASLAALALIGAVFVADTLSSVLGNPMQAVAASLDHRQPLAPE